MNIYKEAARKKIRVATSKGLLSVEQLHDLSLNELDNLAVKLEEDYKNSGGKSFIDKTTTKNKEVKLQFDVVRDILETKMEELEIAQTRQANKEHNRRILELIAEKKDDQLKGKSLKQLEEMLKEEV